MEVDGGRGFASMDGIVDAGFFVHSFWGVGSVNEGERMIRVE